MNDHGIPLRKLERYGLHGGGTKQH